MSVPNLKQKLFSFKGYYGSQISPCGKPLPRGARRPIIDQLEMVTTFTYKPSLVRINARYFELSW